MKVWFITAPGKMEQREMPAPKPAEDEVLLRVRRVGYCGSDLNTFRGKNPMVTLPRIPGHEIAATIEQIGSAVPTSFAKGMQVTVSPYSSCGTCPSCRRQRPNACQFNETMGVQRDGALAEFITSPWRKLYTSATLSLRDLALVEPLTVGFHAVDRGRVTKDEVVAVFGCGVIGLGAIAGAAARGAAVIAVDIDDRKLATAQRAGAKHVVNSARENLHDRMQAIAQGGPDVAIEAVGLPQTFRATIEEVAFTGRVVYIGYAKEPVSYETKLFVQKELDIMGSRNALGDFAEVIKLLESGAFPADEVVTHTVPFAEAGSALAMWDKDPNAVIKIIVGDV